MREFVKVTINKSIKPLDELAKEVEFWHLRYHDIPLNFANNPALELWTIGSVISIERNHILFDTQDYYYNIPLKIANSGTKVSLYNRHDFLAEGVVEKKYYTKTTKSGFAQVPLDKENSIEVQFKMKFNALERQALLYGVEPLSQDDKLFVYTEDNQVHFYGSWTGEEIFRADLVAEVGDIWHFENARIHNDFANEPNKTDYFKNIMVFAKLKAKLFE